MLMIGDKVNIYQLPITQEQLEGQATLRELRKPDDTGDGLSIWMVEFDNEPGELYPRTVFESQ